jgi:hypothetical protein
MIPDVADTFKRKFVHKLCDRYCIERFVDPKKGVIVIQKSPNSIM